MQSDQDLYKQAAQYYQQGNPAETERIVRQILKSNPEYAPALYLLAVLGLDAERYDLAEDLARAAILYQPGMPAFHFTLARILSRRDKKEEAIASYKDALNLKPDFIDALNNMGTTLLSLGRLEEASEAFEKILKSNPDDFNAICNSASILYKQGKFQKSIDRYREALKIDDRRANVYYDIGRSLMILDKGDEALEHFEKAIALQPDYVEPMINIGDIFRARGDYEKALEQYARSKKIRPHEDAFAGCVHIYIEQGRDNDAILEAEYAVKHMPESAQTQNIMGIIYNKTADFSEALDCYRKAITLEPDNAGIYSNMAVTLKNVGRLAESIEMQKKAVSIAPKAWWIYNNLLLTMLYADFVSPEELADTSRKFDEQIASDFARDRPFNNDRNPDRKLRIGYVSPDFRKHAVSYFLSPLLEHDPEKFETFGYSKVEKQDAITEKIKEKFDHWRDIRVMSNGDAAELIEQDKIDILIDLAGHTGNNGLMIFARKPAPVQVTWLGYTSTTGLKAMDYRITDPYVDPPGMTEHLHTETLWCLPDIFCCYQPHENSPGVIDHPPFEDSKHITFGCFNNFSKVSDSTLDTWARILELVPHSKLMLEILGIEDKKTAEDITARIVEHGIPLDRLDLIPYAKSNQYNLYNRIDIALDPFPIVGGTTSMDTLWMGVPLVTLAGNHFGSRMGVTILTNCGLQELIAHDKEEYIRIAVDLAQDKDRLKTLRKGLRERFAASPAMDRERFVKNMEAAYREMWKIWISRN